MKGKLVIISGPTASGKSALAHKIYEESGVFEILNADSMQIYQELPILTAQPTPIPTCYHLYGFLKYNQKFSVAAWVSKVQELMNNIWLRNKIPLIVGGTGLYIKSLIYGLSDIPDIDAKVREEVGKLLTKIGIEEFYRLLQSKDPEIASKLHSNDRYRITRAMEVLTQTGRSISDFYDKKQERNTYNYLHLTLQPSREVLYSSCNNRFQGMLDLGVLDEVAALHTLPNSESSLLTKALGYNSLSSYLNDEISLEEAIDKAQTQTRQYAKRQVTWFKNQAPEATILQFDNFAEITGQALSKINFFIS
jgi:tRNA dimethylallyltransferase